MCTYPLAFAATDEGSSAFGVHAPSLFCRHDDLKEMLDSNKDSLKLEAMKRIVAVSSAPPPSTDILEWPLEPQAGGAPSLPAKGAFISPGTGLAGLFSCCWHRHSSEEASATLYMAKSSLQKAQFDLRSQFVLVICLPTFIQRFGESNQYSIFSASPPHESHSAGALLQVLSPIRNVAMQLQGAGLVQGRVQSDLRDRRC